MLISKLCLRQKPRIVPTWATDNDHQTCNSTGSSITDGTNSLIESVPSKITANDLSNPEKFYHTETTEWLESNNYKIFKWLCLTTVRWCISTWGSRKGINRVEEVFWWTGVITFTNFVDRVHVCIFTVLSKYEINIEHGFD